ncbi:TRAP transporter large permease [Pseudotabrizicola algicola]|uniref:TRAP transporter large permease protein n=1 Tax=Pseudotabrizicola algicola TaxID=2709381 RepID=A0A6B3RXV3_9RHOB|nr:TRAP transporter large permease [Pseudotabrizicola algicola]NEX47949.1 TRAP transporter large permease [Pseudotabrizicola algicola]
MFWTLVVIPVVLMLMGFPIFLILLAGAAATMVFTMNVPLLALPQYLFSSVNAYALLALPFFILAGELMDRGGIASRLVGLMRASMGRVPGKVPMTAITGGAIFGAITGVGAASVATQSKIMLPSLREDGYADEYSSGLLASIGAVGVIIPPSIPMIVYAAAADESIPRLYAAGIVPGLLLVALLGLHALWVGRGRVIPAEEAFSLRRFVPALRQGIWAAGVPAVIIGGIYGGIFSPTEAAGVACFYAFAVSAFVMKELTWADLLAATRTTVSFTAQIMIVIACAGVFSWLITVNQISAQMVQAIQEMALPGWVLLLAINLLLLIVGCLIDPLSAILLLTPLLLPLATAVGVDPVHFGIIVTVNLAIGLFTPPFGINIFVLQSVAKIPLRTIYRGIMPFVGIYLLALMLITYIPAISLAGVRLLIGN